MNIQTALQEIYLSGFTDAAIGLKINAAQSIVTRLRNGNHKGTSYERGQKIMKLHRSIKRKNP